MLDEKIDRLLTDVASVKTKIDFQAGEITELKQQLRPVLEHVNGVRWVFKLGAGIIGVISCVAAVLALLK